MGKKKKQGHFCRNCKTYRANEKFSGKGHQQHICKTCNREIQQQKRVRKMANKKAIEAGLRPLKMDYPKTAQQAASYLQITLDTFQVVCQMLDVEPCGITEGWQNALPVYDIEALIAVYQFVEAWSENISED